MNQLYGRGNQALGFWEINTAAHIDWPQQSRLIEIGWRPGEEADPVIIFGTTIDHAAQLEPDEDGQSPEDYLASGSADRGVFRRMRA